MSEQRPPETTLHPAVVIISRKCAKTVVLNYSHKSSVNRDALGLRKAIWKPIFSRILVSRTPYCKVSDI